MVTPEHAAPAREEIALREVGHTDVARGTVRFLLAFFLTALAAVPVFEFAATTSDSQDTSASWTVLTSLPDDVVTQFHTFATSSGAWKGLLAANRSVVRALVTFENALEDDSRLGRMLRPPTQLFMTRWLGAGNEQAYVGSEGWLFYRPDVEYVTGPGFLDPRRLTMRRDAVDQWTNPPEPDPRRAIVALKRHLEARGIAFVIVPTPVKPSIHPERLAAGYADAAVPLHNPSYLEFVRDLQRQGVLIFDAAQALANVARSSMATQYLATDTHWRPEAMEAVAESLAGFVRAHTPTSGGDEAYTAEPQEVQHRGDIAVMLDLPERQRLYPPETVTIRRIRAGDGTWWTPSRAADVLVLGDSFSNIYSIASVGWGEHAGLIEHLSYQLRRPVDRIVQNDQGAFATRELLRRSGEGRLQGKRLVIYQFAARELMFGDWKVFE